jgi:hypothetical protein
MGRSQLKYRQKKPLKKPETSSSSNAPKGKAKQKTRTKALPSNAYRYEEDTGSAEKSSHRVSLTWVSVLLLLYLFLHHGINCENRRAHFRMYGFILRS